MDRLEVDKNIEIPKLGAEVKRYCHWLYAILRRNKSEQFLIQQQTNL